MFLTLIIFGTSIMRVRPPLQVSLSPHMVVWVVTGSGVNERFVGIRAEGERPRMWKCRIIMALLSAVKVHVGAPSGRQDGRTVVTV